MNRRRINSAFLIMLGVSLSLLIIFVTNLGNVSLAQPAIEATTTLSETSIFIENGSVQFEGHPSNNLVAQASPSHDQIFDIESYDANNNIMSIRNEHTYAGFTSNLILTYPVPNGYLADPSFSSTGTGSCNWIPASQIVRCTGNINSFAISYQYRPVVQHSTINLSLSATWSGFRPNMTFDLFYPASLVFHTSTLTPTLNESGHLLWVKPNASGISTQVTFGIPPQPSLDLTAGHLEVTQAIQDLNNSVGLVANKRTFVRFHYNANENAPWTTAKLTVQKGGQSTVLSPIIVKGPIKASPDRASRYDSFLFELPTKYTSGNVTLTGEINPENFPDEADHSNNTILTSISFETVPKLDLILYRVGYGNVPPPSTFHLNRLRSWLHRAYPIAMGNQGMKLKTRTLHLSDASFNTFTLWKTIYIRRFWDIIQGSSTRYYGMFDDIGNSSRGFGMFKVGIGPTGVPGPYNQGGGWDIDGSYGDVIGAHELGHTYGRHHVNYCGAIGGNQPSNPGGDISPTQTGDEAIYGFDSETFEIYLPNWNDLMTYCKNIWISDLTYHGLMNYFQNNLEGLSLELRTQNQTDRLLVIGSIDANTNQVELQPLFIIPNTGEMEPRIPGNYAIVLRNVSGNELARYPFTPESVDYGSLQLQSTDGDVSNLLLIREFVPYVAETDQIDIEHTGTVLHSISAGSALPNVTLTSPNGGETLTGATVLVSWTASDPDGDPLYFNIQYSADNGQTWEMLVTNIAGTRVEVDADNIARSNQGLFRVWASDGIHTASDQSDTSFTVPNHIPVVEITTPHEPVTLLISQTLSLEANAYDIDSGSMPANQLHWISDIDGVLGDGQQLSITGLSLGTHTITFQADDGAGGLASDTISITIVDDPVLVMPPDGLLVGPSMVLFETTSDVISDTISIYNQNLTNTISWNAIISETWIQLDQTSGSTPGKLTVIFNDTVSLEDGFHLANITLSSPNVPGQSVNIPVFVMVGPDTNVSSEGIFLPLILK